MTQIEQLVIDFSKELLPVVTTIENDPFPTTKDNYGKYYELLSGFSENSVRFVASIALIRCQANTAGVIAAMKLIDIEAGNKLQKLVEASVK